MIKYGKGFHGKSRLADVNESESARNICMPDVLAQRFAVLRNRLLSEPRHLNPDNQGSIKSTAKSAMFLVFLFSYSGVFGIKLF